MEDYYFGAMVGAVGGISMTVILLFGRGTISFEDFIIPLVVVNPLIIGLLMIWDSMHNKKPE